MAAIITPSVTVVVEYTSVRPRGDGRVDGLITITPTGFDTSAARKAKPVIGIVDRSGSTGGQRIADEIAGLNDVVRNLAVGTQFGLVKFGLDPRDRNGIVVPVTTITDANRGDIQRRISSLTADGGTPFSQGLSDAINLFEQNGLSEALFLFLTDGAIDSADVWKMRDQLGRIKELAKAGRHIAIAGRGIGSDWKIEEVEELSLATGMTADLVANAGDLYRSFSDEIEAAAGRTMENARVRLWMPAAVEEIIEFRQWSPVIVPLKDKMVLEPDGLTRSFSNGAMGNEPVQFQFALRMKPQNVGGVAAAARVTFRYTYNGTEETVDGNPSMLKVEWSDDPGKSMRAIPLAIQKITGVEEIVTAVREGLEARLSGDLGKATARLSEAVDLATQRGQTSYVEIIKEHATVATDKATGKVTATARAITDEGEKQKTMRAVTRTKRTEVA